ncbi:hypothetical protein JTB14_021140 [Gonioctena quinquepunctata]|nr:hypothetical protein JTB14_021140 [Gonioctena quinquepunctata]
MNLLIYKDVLVPQEDWDVEKYEIYMRSIVNLRISKTDEENHKFFDQKYSDWLEPVRYIQNIIQGKQEIFDKDEERIHNEYFAEYTVACEMYDKVFPDLWRKYRKNRIILGKNSRKKPEQTNIMTEKGMEKGGEADVKYQKYYDPKPTINNGYIIKLQSYHP